MTKMMKMMMRTKMNRCWLEEDEEPVPIASHDPQVVQNSHPIEHVYEVGSINAVLAEVD